mmetsp:Transcript_12116/g.19720  ORF Transcript_12116/g.19720 Transcript_12116/m.19720 type:complete len:145 (+) Transcript_12116:42-476(+)
MMLARSFRVARGRAAVCARSGGRFGPARTLTPLSRANVEVASLPVGVASRNIHIDIYDTPEHMILEEKQQFEKSGHLIKIHSKEEADNIIGTLDTGSEKIQVFIKGDEAFIETLKEGMFLNITGFVIETIPGYRQYFCDTAKIA